MWRSFLVFFSIISLIGMSTSPTILTEDGTGRNFLLITIMMISPLILVLEQKISKGDIVLIVLALFLILNPIIFHPETLRWSTILFGILFCLHFLAYKRSLIFSQLNISTVLTTIKILIIAFAITILIQQFCVLMGLPIFNISNYDIREPWKLNSLGPEPSHSVRYLTILMFSFLSLKEIINDKPYDLKQGLKSDVYVWLSFLWVMLTSVSATAFVFLGLIFLKFLKRDNLIILILIAIITIIILGLLNNTTYERTIKFAITALSFDENSLIKSDPGAASRIAPMIICAKNIDILSVNGIFGHGIDSVTKLMNIYFPSIHTGGGIFALFYEYGFIPFLLFGLFSFRTIAYKNGFIAFLFWIFCCLNEGFNMQLTWSTLIFFTTINHYKNLRHTYE